MRPGSLAAMPGRSLSPLAPSEPVQKVMPLLEEGHEFTTSSKSFSVETTLGRPNIGNGGSSG